MLLRQYPRIVSPGRQRPLEAPTPGSRGDGLRIVRNQELLWDGAAGDLDADLT